MLSNETHLQERAPQRPLVEKRWWETLKLRWEWATLPLGLLVLLASWQLVVVVGDYPEFVLPSPMAVAAKFVTAIWSGLLWRHLRVTLAETLLGFMLGFLTATLMGYWLAKRPVAERLIAPWLVAMQAVPVVAVAPLLVIWFGYDLAPKIAVVALICFFTIVVSTVDGLSRVDPDYANLIRAMGGSEGDVFRRVRLPGALPAIFSGAKIAVTYSVIGAVVGEWVGASRGIGIYMVRAADQMLTERVFAAIMLSSLLSITLFLIVSWIEHLALPWRRSSTRRQPARR